MKKTLAVILIVVFGVVGLAYAQSAKDVYEAVKKAQLTAAETEYEEAITNAMTDAKTAFDSFKDSPEAKKNPEFVSQIEAALQGLSLYQTSGGMILYLEHTVRALDLAKQHLRRNEREDADGQ